MPRQGEAPSFAQIYIHDGTPEAELENRQRHLGEASLPELRGLQLMLHEYNRLFIETGSRSDARRENGHPSRRCSGPSTAPEVAVIVPGDGYWEEVASRDTVARADRRSSAYNRDTPRL